jgi:selenocysteine-specific elongation factor
MHVIGTAGHVDHGKSTLVERLTGIDPDRLAEEKRRGLTIDLGFAWLRLPSGREIGLIDVPGHERFIKNMLAGAGGITVCLFVVAANEGWMPQSAEHLAILDVLGISSGVVALTKRDLVDDETLEIGALEARERLEVTTFARAPIVPCSGLTGEGLDDLVMHLDEAVSGAPPAPDRGRPRLWVDRVFTIAGAGTVVTGTLTGGTLARGHVVELAPEGRRARVRSIQSHKREVDEIGPGNRVALNLVGLEREGAGRGDAVVAPDRWRATRRVDARVRVLPPEIIGREHTLEEKGAHLIYVGSAETPARVKLLGAPKISPGETGYAQLYLRDPLPLARGDRFVLRDAGRVLTFGGGVVLDPLPDPARRGDETRIALLRRLDAVGPEEALEVLVAHDGALPERDALLRAGASTAPPTLVRLAATLVSAERAASLQRALLAELESYHGANPLQRGMARESLRSRLALGSAEFDDLVLRVEGVVQEGPTVRLVTHRVTLAEDQQQQRQRVLAQLEGAGYAPPPAAELDADSELLHALVDADDLVPIADFFITRARAEQARALVRSRIESDGPLTVAQIRDLLGTSRRYAVPLCEWLDASGATRRAGDLRTLGPRP